MARPDPVLRICASYETLGRQECAVPERCLRYFCQRCARPVHYDPAASIPALGKEFVICDLCLDDLVAEMQKSS